MKTDPKMKYECGNMIGLSLYDNRWWCTDCLWERGNEVKILKLKARIIERLPFCPDHRDKVAGKSCRECEIENLKRLLNNQDNKIRSASKKIAGLQARSKRIGQVAIEHIDEFAEERKALQKEIEKRDKQITEMAQ